ncbi:conserved hypothetical protein [Ricinus communis]|uniref:Uncharacterized protein n=1 Tax=Ricinus communis TaxID=3988 RepID=B9RCI5_RICCO|nr:conserved hypothetical protein [Ricinus communis]
MDAVELNYPVALAAAAGAAPELFGGRDRVTVMEAEAEVELCNSLLSEKDATSAVNSLESTPLNKVPAPELCQHTSHRPSFPSEDVSKQLHFGSAKIPSWIPRHEEVQVQRKVGQVSRSGSGCSKRPRVTLLEDTTDPATIDNAKEACSKQVSHPIKCESNEKTQSAKQRNNFSSKRGDRRNSKVLTKTKYDSFSVKASLASFSSAAAGNNFFGLYGLKTDVHDITKLVDDLSLDDLLQGIYECPKLGKDKGKKATNTTESVLHSVRKACSILQLTRSAQFQNFAEIDSCSNEIIPTGQTTSISIVGNGDNGDSSMTELCSYNKESCSKRESSANFLNLSFEQPKGTLERLALPPPKDLEALLLDAAKPAVSSRNAPDPRPGKQASRRPSLPPFPWSHTFGGNCRTNSDANKLLTSRSTCQGRWVKLGNTFNSLGIVPKYTSLTLPSSLGTDFIKESGSDLKNHRKVGQCPRLLAAAQTLYDIATSTSRLNQDGMVKWPKKPSQKVMKARKSKSAEKPEDIFAPSTLVMGSDQMEKNSVDHTLTSKRLKLSTIENKNYLSHVNGVRKGPINWSTPKSSRSSPNKSVRDSTACIVKQSCMTPPPAKVLHRSCNGQQKFHKLIRTDWNRECDRQD